MDKSYNHKSIIYWYVTVVICKLYPLISNSSSLKDFFFTSIRALSFASCGRLIIGDITSKDESFSIHALPHMFHTTSFAYSLWLHLLPFSITQLASSCITSSIVFYDFGSQKFPHTSYNKFPRNNHSSRTWNTGKFVSKMLVEFNWWNIDFAEIWERNFNQKKKNFVLFCDITHWEKSAKSSKIIHICFNIRILFFTKVFQETYFTNDAIYNYWFYRATNVMLLTEHYEQSPLERGLMELI